MWRGAAEHDGKLMGCALMIAVALLVLAFFVGRWTSHL